jgi:hypothetical protein
MILKVLQWHSYTVYSFILRKLNVTHAEKVLNYLLFLTILSSSLTLVPLETSAKPILYGARDYVQQRKEEGNYGAAVTHLGCVGDLKPNGATYVLAKTLWLNFLNGTSYQWLESGCTKSLTSLSITYVNPD